MHPQERAKHPINLLGPQFVRPCGDELAGDTERVSQVLLLGAEEADRF